MLKFFLILYVLAHFTLNVYIIANHFANNAAVLKELEYSVFS